MNRSNLPRLPVLAAALLGVAGAAHGQAFLTQSIDTTSLNTASWDTASTNVGPWPFSNFGVQASDSLGLLASASTSGSTTFQAPSFTPGEVLAVGSSVNYAYTPNWIGGSIGSNAGLSASASFNYSIGPFSGSKSIFDATLNTAANGTLGGGATLTGGTVSGTAVGPSRNFGLTASATLASASVGVNVGVNLNTTLSYAPTVQYGYYEWVNTTGGYSASDALTWHGVSSGPLNINLAQGLAGQAHAATFYLNFAPAVLVDMPITPTSSVTLPVSGNLNVSVFGQTLVDKSIPLGSLTAYTENYQTWDNSLDFTGKYYSVELTTHQTCPNCANYTVDGSSPLSATKLNPPGGGGSGGLTGGSGSGSWDGSFSLTPMVPGVCDPATGQCYASNDPNLPVGSGATLTTTDTPVPLPGTLGLLTVACALLMATRWLSPRRLRQAPAG